MTAEARDALRPLLDTARALQRDWLLERGPFTFPHTAADTYVESLERALNAAVRLALAAPPVDSLAPPVEGEVWEDLEPRSAGRLIEVRFVTGTTAIVRTVRPADASTTNAVGRETEVALHRFHNNRHHLRGFARIEKEIDRP